MKPDWWDAIAIAGCATISAGIWMWSQPAALIFAGAVAVFIGAFGPRRKP